MTTDDQNMVRGVAERTDGDALGISVRAIVCRDGEGRLGR